MLQHGFGTVATWVKNKTFLLLSMIDFTHILDFATQLPHPSDIGIIKPSGGFALIPALCGLGAVFGASQFFYYSDDSKRIDPWAKPENYESK
tara:strand:- start:60 stop:335 length:276 start_codon:yes stop_codon:yes gene_type:complete